MTEKPSVDTPCYLPRTLIDRWLGDPDQAPIWHEWLTGSLMHVDVTGFTVMNEQLSKLGNEGGEIMVGILNRFFDRMLGIAEQRNGLHMKYGGDAMLLLFPGEHHAWNACLAGLEMQEAMAEFSEIDVLGQTYSLRMRIGAHSGRYLSASIGDPKGLLHYMLIGKDVNRTAQVEPMAEPGQVVVSTESMEAAGGHCRFRETSHEGIHLVVDAERPEPEEAAPSDRNLPTGVLCRYLMPPIAEGKVKTRDRDHRRVSIAFISLRGLTEMLAEEGEERTVAEASTYVEMLFDCAGRYGGYLSQSDAAEKGVTIVVLFGAPISHGDHEQNACRFAFDLNERLKGSGLMLKHQVGINTGYVFAGETGSSRRRDYTTTGDNMNLAARLMGVSGVGNILISAATAEKLDDSFVLTRMDPIKVKGKSNFIDTFRLESVRKEMAIPDEVAESRFVGREEELASLHDLAGRVRQERSGWAFVQGDPGIGKTRLGAELMSTLKGQGWKAAMGICQFYDMNNAFSAWKYPLRTLFGIGSGDAAADVERKVTDFFGTHCPAMVDFAPLLAGPLGINLDTNAVVESLDNKERRQKLIDTMRQLIVEFSHGAPLVVMLDNAQWIDSSSAEMLRGLVDIEGAALFVVLLSQTEKLPASLSEAGPAAHIRLGELGHGECRAFLGEQSDLDEELIEEMISRAKGNPLFLKELASNVSPDGKLKLPDSIYDVITASFDKLNNEDKTLVRRASVIGQTFDVQVLKALEQAGGQA